MKAVTKNTYSLAFWSMPLLLILCALVSLMIGPLGFVSPFKTIYESGNNPILYYRLSRILLAIIAGSSLAASGASLQAIFRNPLADPHLFGISGGAALGAALVIAFLSDHAFIMPSIGAMGGGLIAFLFVFFFLNKSRVESLSHCLLVGILINSLAAALITLLKTTLPMHKTQSLLFWLIGHITVLSPLHLLIVVPLWLLGMSLLWMIKGELEIMSFGIEESKLLGINTSKVLKMAVVANCVLIGNVVAFAGMIGFLGLVVPHLIRLSLTTNLRTVLPIASFAGAILLVFFDGLSRLSFAIIKSEIPTGALSALFLGPVFFLLLIKNNEHD